MEKQETKFFKKMVFDHYCSNLFSKKNKDFNKLVEFKRLFDEKENKLYFVYFSLSPMQIPKHPRFAKIFDAISGKAFKIENVFHKYQDKVTQLSSSEGKVDIQSKVYFGVIEAVFDEESKISKNVVSVEQMILDAINNASVKKTEVYIPESGVPAAYFKQVEELSLPLKM